MASTSGAGIEQNHYAERRTDEIGAIAYHNTLASIYDKRPVFQSRNCVRGRSAKSCHKNATMQGLAIERPMP